MQFTLEIGHIMITGLSALIGLVWLLLRESIKNGDQRTYETLNLRLTRIEQDHLTHSEMMKEFQIYLQRIELQLAAINSKLENVQRDSVAIRQPPKRGQ